MRHQTLLPAVALWHFLKRATVCWFGLRESVARTIRMLQSPKFALDEADKCFQAGEMWLALRLCEMGLKFYSCALLTDRSLGNGLHLCWIQD